MTTLSEVYKRESVRISEDVCQYMVQSAALYDSLAKLLPMIDQDMGLLSYGSLRYNRIGREAARALRVMRIIDPLILDQQVPHIEEFLRG